MTAWRIEIANTVRDPRSAVWREKIQTAGHAVEKVQIRDIYTIAKDFSDDEQRRIADMLTNPVFERASINTPTPHQPFDYAVEIGFRPGVTDNLGHTVRESIEDLLGTKFAAPHEAVYASRLMLLSGVHSEEEAADMAALFYNPLIEQVHIRSCADFEAQGGMGMTLPRVDLPPPPEVLEINLNVPDEELMTLSKKGVQDRDGSHRGPLALRLPYMHAIRDYYAKQGRNPTDIELESLAQTWSEHCKHTIFADPIDDVPDGLFKHYIRRATQDIRAQKGADDFCISVFSDNAGGIVFDENWVITDKVETHNTPSALEPFGGAITGIVGVNRDAMGYGMGAKPVINRYGFCTGYPGSDPDLYRAPGKQNPALSPDTILDGVVAGVNAGGNQSGIPAPQGFVYFDDRFAGKPLVFAGTVGLIPRTIHGKNASEKQARPGDRIIVAGGKVGRDGIHGATFSSEILNPDSPVTAVQIGDPITQKKLSDAVIKEARDQGLYTSITDNGAGGISCSVAEMARECGGFEVTLDHVPLKYPNLAPWEIWISESQERMTFAVPPENVAPFMQLLARRGCEAWDIGAFTDSGRCVVQYGGKTIMDMDMAFLHEGLPPQQQTSREEKETYPEPTGALSQDMNGELLELLSCPNIAGYGFISRQYDHEVQAGSVIKPLQGVGQVNGGASVTRPVLTSERAVVLSQALCPNLSEVDSYAMALCAIDDAIATAVAAGANIDHMAILDNFCWCSGDDPVRLAQLHAACRGCYDGAVAYGTPFVSGKDSMFNDFHGFDGNSQPLTVSVPPTLLISTISVMPDARHAVGIDCKCAGDLLYILGETKADMTGSQYWARHGYIGNAAPTVDMTSALDRYRRFFTATQKNIIASAQAVGFGGLGVALAKSCIAGGIGAQIDTADVPGASDCTPEEILFAESRSRLLVSIAPDNRDAFESLFPETKPAGRVAEGKSLTMTHEGNPVVDTPIAKLHERYHKPFLHR